MVCPEGLGTGTGPYFTKTTMDKYVCDDLLWWRTCLIQGKGRFECSWSSVTLVPMWGNGSGTGTGGTFVIPDGHLRMWKGKWMPILVYKLSSN